MELRVIHRQCSERDDLIVRYMPLAHRLAGRYRRGEEDNHDLLQVAGLALVKAADRFDPHRGYPFAAFAGPRIIDELDRYLLRRRPNVNELARHIGLDADLVAEGLLAAAAREMDDLGRLGDEDEDERLEPVPDVTTIFAGARRLARRGR